MKERKKYTYILILGTFIGTVLIMIGGYLWFIKPDNIEEKNNQQEKGTNNKSNNSEKIVARNFDEVIKNFVDYNGKQSKYEMSNGKPNQLVIDDGQYAVLSQDGKVSIKKDDKSIEIFSITDAIDISFLYWPNLYILRSNGEVYWYDLTKIDEDDEKIASYMEIDNITKFVTITYCPTKDAGCNSYLGAIDKNNGYIEIANWGF